MPLLINELTKIINNNTLVVLTPKETILVYKLFSMVSMIIERATSSNLITFLRSNHCEEFK